RGDLLLDGDAGGRAPPPWAPAPPRPLAAAGRGGPGPVDRLVPRSWRAGGVLRPLHPDRADPDLGPGRADPHAARALPVLHAAGHRRLEHAADRGRPAAGRELRVRAHLLRPLRAGLLRGVRGGRGGVRGGAPAAAAERVAARAAGGDPPAPLVTIGGRGGGRGGRWRPRRPSPPRRRDP